MMKIEGVKGLWKEVISSYSNGNKREWYVDKYSTALKTIHFGLLYFKGIAAKY
jgi:hypothetical protein